MRDPHVQGTPCPPLGPSRGPAVLTVPPGPPVPIILASPCLYGVTLHWGGSRSVYCPGPDAGCASCGAGKARLWYGYAMCVMRLSGSLRVVEVSQAAYQHCPSLAACEGKLIGMGAEISRMGESKNSGLRIRLAEGTRLAVPAGIPNIRCVLSRLLGVALE